MPKADKRGLERLWGGGSGVISGVEGGGFMGVMGWLAWGISSCGLRLLCPPFALCSCRLAGACRSELAREWGLPGA